MTGTKKIASFGENGIVLRNKTPYFHSLDWSGYGLHKFVMLTYHIALLLFEHIMLQHGTPHTHTHRHSLIHAHTHSYTHTHTHTLIHTHSYTHTTHTPTHSYTHTHTHIHSLIHTHSYTHSHSNIQHTHTHTLLTHIPLTLLTYAQRQTHIDKSHKHKL